MMRTTHRKSLVFYGETQANTVINWLNDSGDGSASRKRVLKLVVDLIELHRLADLLNWRSSTNEDRTGWSRFEDLGNQVNRALRRYVKFPHLIFNTTARSASGRWLPLHEEFGPFRWSYQPMVKNHLKFPLKEIVSVGTVEDAVKEGWFLNIRQCHCGNWFFAKKPDAKSCSSRCRKSRYYFASYKEKRKKNYAAARQREALWLKSASKKVQSK